MFLDSRRMENVSVFGPEADARASLFAPAERAVSCFRGVAQFVRRSCTVLLSVVSSFSVCVVTSLCDAHDDSPSMAQENCSCTVITVHFMTRGSGAVAVIRFACPCTVELLVIWWYGG